MRGDSDHPLDRLLADVIAEEGGSCRPAEIRDEVVTLVEQVTAEQVATGRPMAEFCHWTIAGGVGVFVFIGDGLDLYVVPCPPSRQYELVNRFDRMARTDVEAFRARLNARYGKDKPDLMIKPDLAYDWLFGDRDVETPSSATVRVVPVLAPEDEMAVAGEPATDVEPATEPAEERAEETKNETAAEAERTAATRRADEPAPDAQEAAEPEESEDAPYQPDPTLEEMMAAIRAQGGGKGNRPFRPSDF